MTIPAAAIGLFVLYLVYRTTGLFGVLCAVVGVALVAGIQGGLIGTVRDVAMAVVGAIVQAAAAVGRAL